MFPFEKRSTAITFQFIIVWILFEFEFYLDLLVAVFTIYDTELCLRFCRHLTRLAVDVVDAAASIKSRSHII